MIHRKTERFPIYDSVFLDIIIADNSKEIQEALDDKDETFFACATKRNIEIDGRFCKSIAVILCTEEGEITPPIIVHESVHVKNMLWGHLGIKSKYRNDEHEAYFVEWVFAEVSKEFAIFEAKQKGETNE